jgi:DNA-binding SARP family transcriptional activator
VAGGTGLHLELLGGFRVRAGGRPVTRAPGARQQELIAYLVLHAHEAVSRQRVAEALWPDSTDAQALTNLRRELHHLRESWSDLDRLIDAAPRTLGWRTAAASVDVLAFESAAARGLKGDRPALEAAAQLYAGDLLPDCAGEWIEGDRQRLQQRARTVLTQLVDLLEHDRAFGDAIERAQQLLRLDPLDEPSWCALMRCHAQRGERATALHLYQQCAALVKKELGVQPSAATRATYREILDLDAEPSTASPSPPAASYALVGRDAEWRTIVRAWRAVEHGRAQLLLIRGEAGIGKTRLAEELLDWCRAKTINAASTRCYPGEGRLAYAPIAAWLQSAAMRVTLGALDGIWLTDVARLHPGLLTTRPEVAAPEQQLENWQRVRFFESLSQAFRHAAPLVLVVDDLQWSDAETLEWLHYFLRSTSERACLVVGTVRSEEEHDNQPLQRLIADLERDERVTILPLGRLDSAATAQLASEVAEHPLDEATVSRTFQETEGHPLFIIERGRMEGATGSATAKALPRVQSVVAARLALLSEPARGAAEVASAVGRDFTFPVLAHVSDLEEDALVAALDELWRRQIVRAQAGERWDFTHDRIREVAYEGIGPARRRLIHRRIAQAMELLFTDRLDEASASIAMHLERGGQTGRAIEFFARAASVAARVSANEEAIRCLMQALTLLERLPPGHDRDDRELTLREPLAAALSSARGYSALEMERNLERVFALFRTDTELRVVVPWLWAGFSVRYVLGDLRAARGMAEQALTLGADNRSSRCEAHLSMAGALLSFGELEPARRHFDASVDGYDESHPQRSPLGPDLGVFAHAWSSHALWLIGEDGLAVERARAAIALAGRRDDPFSQALALAYSALLHQLRRDVDQVLSDGGAAVALCERHGFAYYDDWARTLVGWARGQTEPDAGITIIRTALERLDGRRALARRPYYLSLLVETLARAGHRDKARSTLDAAVARAQGSGEVWWLPALYLQKSELATSATDRGLALSRALELARAQGSRALEQRILAADPGTVARTLAERPTS